VEALIAAHQAVPAMPPALGAAPAPSSAPRLKRYVNE
jgi:hypothetical protein